MRKRASERKSSANRSATFDRREERRARASAPGEVRVGLEDRMDSSVRTGPEGWVFNFAGCAITSDTPGTLPRGGLRHKRTEVSPPRLLNEKGAPGPRQP